jgi:glutaredoxin 3
MMPPILIYTKASCPFCVAAKDLLRRKGAAYEEIDVTGRPGEQQAMSAKANGRRTVPQIFIGAIHVGGCDDLYDLEATGGLDPLLAA